MIRRRPVILLVCGVLLTTASSWSVSAEPAKNGSENPASGEFPASGELLSPEVGMYPSTVGLEHAGAANGNVLASTISFGPDGGFAPVFESTDDGATFVEVGRITDPAFATGLCCGSLLELPRAIGSLPAGALLWIASVGADAGAERRMYLPVFQSQDSGRTWSYLSTCAAATTSAALWEPELAVSATGELGCYFSDEGDQPAHSQVIARTVSTDGVSWGPVEHLVASADPAHRPGMSVIRPLPDGRFYMSYEICGTGDQYDCAAYFRLSEDGVNWGDPTELGVRVTTADGRFFAHAPKITVVADGTPDGRILTVGQELKYDDGAIAPGNGTTLFSSAEPGVVDAELAAPVEVPGAFNDPCPNYSSALLPVADAAEVLEIATDYDADGVCKAYYATGALTATR